MRKVIINNLSTLTDKIAVKIACDMLNVITREKGHTFFIHEYGVRLRISNDAAAGKITFVFTDVE